MAKATQADRPRGDGWDRITAFCSLIVAAATLGVVFYQANLMRQQTRAATWPYLSVQTSASANSLKFIVTNSGVGPARMEAVTVTIDGKPVQTWEEALSTLIGERADGGYSFSDVSGYVFAPQESRDALVIEDPVLLQKLVPQLRRMTASICYCSVLDECTVSHTIRAGLERDRDVVTQDRCATELRKAQFRN